ncbi:MAG: hypothetical protein ACOY71_04615, partial [Gemmatimonadota bacterium]
MAEITRTGLIRICRLTLTRFSRSFVDSARSPVAQRNKGHPQMTGALGPTGRWCRQVGHRKDPFAPRRAAAGSR